MFFVNNLLLVPPMMSRVDIKGNVCVCMQPSFRISGTWQAVQGIWENKLLGNMRVC